MSPPESALAVLVPLATELELVTRERDQYRRDFESMSVFAAQLTTRLKLQGCSDADIEHARITAPLDPVLVARAQTAYTFGKRLIELPGSDEWHARTDDRIAAWIDRHRDDEDASALASRVDELEQRLQAIAALSRLPKQTE